MDDLWALMYVLIEMHCGLPWQNEVIEKNVGRMKYLISDEDLLLNFPRNFNLFNNQ